MLTATSRLFLAAATLSVAHAAGLELNLRSRVEAFKGSGEWQEVQFRRSLPVNETAILICDMWDNHWCKGAALRVDKLADKMDPVLARARAGGLLIIHAPSEVMDFYKETPQRQAMLQLAAIDAPPPVEITDGPFPIDDKQGGCDTHDEFYKAWKRENARLHIASNDVISDKGAEIYSLLRLRGIRNLLVMGVHTNMCILNRSFAIKQMTKWGVRCVLVRDLTDSMYDPQARPFVSHDQGTELVIQHIEKYWCPTALSADLLRALPLEEAKERRGER
jgi:nicotinamidase-related amidase